MRTTPDNNTDEIEQIVTQLRARQHQLQLLHTQQSVQINRLIELVTHHETPAQVPAAQAASHRQATSSSQRRRLVSRSQLRFAIGDQVIVTNPKASQATEGVITKITPKRITILATDGSYISRDPKNLDPKITPIANTSDVDDTEESVELLTSDNQDEGYYGGHSTN